jgi:tetratricopeptide (TPR) repeat protein
MTGAATRMLAGMLAGLLLVAAAAAPAQEDSESRRERETRKTPAMSEPVYRKLTEAQELIEARKYDEGLAILHELEQEEGLNSYEKAQTYNYLAYTYFTQERYRDAIRAYEQVLAQPDLPLGLEQNSLYTLAQLQFIVEDYRKAIDLINRWLELAEKPTENAYMLLGQAYYQLDQYRESLEPLKKAYDMVKARGDQPKENLLLLLRVNYFELDDYQSMLKVLRELVALYPKREYWLTLAGVYSELKEYEKQMSILEMLYEQGLLTGGSEQLNLANLYLLHEVPYKAAKVIQQGIDQGVIERDVRNLRLLSQAWLQAKESEKSLPPLEAAADMSRDGELNLYLGQAYLNLDRYEEAADALQEGIRKGGIKNLGQANVMLGLALFELDKLDAARRALKVEREYEETRDAANQWLSYVENEAKRQEELRASLERRKTR